MSASSGPDPDHLRSGATRVVRDENHGNDDLSVPLFGSWRNAYVTVVAVFVVEVALFFVFSRYFS